MQQLATTVDEISQQQCAGTHCHVYERYLRVVDVTDGWDDIRHSDVSLLIQRRKLARLEDDALLLLKEAPFERIGAGSVKDACKALGPLPGGLAWDIVDLARRFTDLMGIDHIRIRLEAVTSNSCRKIHADYTDLRLITTYAGPATQVLQHGTEPVTGNLWPMQSGWIGLFKGRLFEKGHTACLHRSPPAGDLGERRLVLVIDAPQFPTQGQAR